MNINPIPENISNENIQENHILDESQEKKAYQIFTNVNGNKGKHEILLTEEATVEDAMKIVIGLEQGLQSCDLEELDFYLSSKKGKVKDDFPAIDKSQKIAKVNFERFVIVHKNISLQNQQENVMDQNLDE